MNTLGLSARSAHRREFLFYLHRPPAPPKRSIIDSMDSDAKRPLRQVRQILAVQDAQEKHRLHGWLVQHGFDSVFTDLTKEQRLRAARFMYMVSPENEGAVLGALHNSPTAKTFIDTIDGLIEQRTAAKREIFERYKDL